MKIAIDGPSGAGKSTIAKMAAKELGFVYIDTGAMYRTIGLYCVENNISTDEYESVSAVLKNISIDIKYTVEGQSMFLNGEDVTDKIRTPQISSAASDVAKIKDVRCFLVEMQKKMAEKNNVIMDGRDIGTSVLPDADLKIFLTASAEDRAERRYKELIEKGIKTDYETVLADMIQRDKNDSEREISPLSVAEDAVVVDTGGYSLEKSYEVIMNLIKENGGAKYV